MLGTTAPASSFTLLCHCPWHLSLEPSSSCTPETSSPWHHTALTSAQLPAVTVLLSVFVILSAPITQTGGLAQHLVLVTVLVYRLPHAQNSSVLWCVLRFPFWLYFFFLHLMVLEIELRAFSMQGKPSTTEPHPQTGFPSFLKLNNIPMCVHQQALGWCSYFSLYERFWDEYGSIDVSFRTYFQLFWVRA